MPGWDEALDFRSRRAIAAGIAAPHPRQRESQGRDMVGGTVSWALVGAVKAHGKRVGRPVYKLLYDMSLGQSTWDRMVKCKPIARTTALKIVTFLGTSLPQVLSLSQQESQT